MSEFVFLKDLLLFYLDLIYNQHFYVPGTHSSINNWKSTVYLVYYNTTSKPVL